jgi:AcrR family transcriptional regulator
LTFAAPSAIIRISILILMSRAIRRAAMRPPRQARSRATLDRLLAAAVELLAERRFEQASVAEIVARAGSSVGAFYTRFPDKDSLLDYLDERLFEGARAQWNAFLDPARWRGVSAAEIVSRLVRQLIRKRRQHTGMLRALALYARDRPDPRFLARARRLNEHGQRRLRALLLARRRELGHPRPGQAIRAGLFIVDAAIREAVLFPEIARLRLSDTALARELTDVYLACLRIAKTRSRSASHEGDRS